MPASLPAGSAQHAPAAGSRRRPIQYERILVPVTASLASERAVTTAAMLASERKGLVTVLSVIEVPKELPLDALFPDEERESKAILSHAVAILERYGVNAVARTIHATTASSVILETADEVQAQLIVMGTERRNRHRHAAVGKTLEHVLKRASCRVMIVTASPT